MNSYERLCFNLLGKRMKGKRDEYAQLRNDLISARFKTPFEVYQARNAVRIAPLDAQSHNLMGMIMTEAQRPHVGKHHARRATNRRPSPARSCSPTLPGT